MAAGNVQIYNGFLERLINSTANWATDDHYAALMNSSFTHSDTDTNWTAILADVCVSGDYAPQDLTGEAVVATGSTTKIDADLVDFGNTVTITARTIVVLEGTAGAQAGADLLCFSADLDDTVDLSSSNGNFDVDWNASGILDFNQA